MRKREVPTKTYCYRELLVDIFSGNIKSHMKARN